MNSNRSFFVLLAPNGGKFAHSACTRLFIRSHELLDYFYWCTLHMLDAARVDYLFVLNFIIIIMSPIHFCHYFELTEHTRDTWIHVHCAFVTFDGKQWTTTWSSYSSITAQNDFSQMKNRILHSEAGKKTRVRCGTAIYSNGKMSFLVIWNYSLMRLLQCIEKWKHFAKWNSNECGTRYIASQREFSRPTVTPAPSQPASQSKYQLAILMYHGLSKLHLDIFPSIFLFPIYRYIYLVVWNPISFATRDKQLLCAEVALEANGTKDNNDDGDSSVLN